VVTAREVSELVNHAAVLGIGAWLIVLGSLRNDLSLIGVGLGLVGARGVAFAAGPTEGG